MTQHITAQYVREYFDGSAKEGESKLSVFLTSLRDAEVEEVRKVLAEVAKESATLKTRCAEVRQIWGAIHHIPDAAGITPSMGYNKAADAARTALAEAGIDWKGQQKKTREEREEAKAEAALVQATAEVLKAVSFDSSKLAEGMTKVAKEKAGKLIFDAIWASHVVVGVTLSDLEIILAETCEAAMAALEKHGSEQKEVTPLKQAA